MAVTFTGRAVGQFGTQEHRGYTEQADAGSYETDAGDVEVSRGLDELRKDQVVAVGAGEHEESEDADLPDAWVDEDAVDGLGGVVDVIAGVVDAAGRTILFRLVLARGRRPVYRVEEGERLR